ncbi:MAG: endopeptidase La [Chitinophagales bacterium]|nr:endopeptidase La [Chitinophagales bacterium]MDW8427699.1 endopeptidase La [Chitinophagales bacterium]
MTEEVEFLPFIAVNEQEKVKEEVRERELPVLPVRNTVLFPSIIIPITVGREKSIQALKEAHGSDKLIGVVAQVSAGVDDPSPDDLFRVGTVAHVLKILRMPDGSTTAILQGRSRFEIKKFIHTEPYLRATVQILADDEPQNDKQYDAIILSIRELAAKAIQLSPQLPSEAGIMLRNIESAEFLMHFVVNNLSAPVAEKQKVLEIGSLKDRAQKVLSLLEAEVQMLELKNEIQSKVRSDIEKQQKDYFLQQQLKTIQEELGQTNPVEKEVQELRERAAKKKWNQQVKEHFEKELQKLERSNPMSPEYAVVQNYLEVLLSLPWGVFTKDRFDLKRARKILDQDHYGLEKVKDRILEYLAVLKLKGDLKSPILCFVGPPGVGKTSLGKSIAKALGRKYVRMSLGGLHDEAEIRGHRKTYIGAMPGRIIQSIRKAQSSNPVFVLDEIDKVGVDFRGDPSSALLEVLDPEQNSTFFDNYLEVEYDLSKVLFIATANTLTTIQPALRDRMEIIEINGYSLEEKVHIGLHHLLPKQIKEHGLKPRDVVISPQLMERIIEDYTRESGVRELDRKLAAIMRHVAKQVAFNEKRNPELSEADLKTFLGIKRYDRELYCTENPPGVAIGLAWTSVGGEILFVETVISKGKGNLKLTGNLGDVMKESATTALTYIKAHADLLGINVDDLDKKDIHVHVPEGAIPKDGPSAGITMLVAMASALSGRKVKDRLAMTGEITLRGRVLPVGGIKEKVLAARRVGMKEVMLPRLNEKDVSEINPEFIRDLKFIYVDTMDEVLRQALMPVKAKKKKRASKTVKAISS